MALNLVVSRIAIALPPKNLEEEIIREIAKRILQNRYGFSENQINALFSIQKNENKTKQNVPCSTVNIVISNQVLQETIGEMTHQFLQDKLSIRDIRAEIYALTLSVLNANAGSSHHSRLRRELRNIDITEDANKIQIDNQKKAKTIDYPDEFTLESVKERLDAYDLKTSPNYQALVDVMVMLCIHPVELITLRITDAGNQERAKELLTWIQNAISSDRMGDPGAVYTVVTNGAKNIAHAYTITGEALRHSSDNHASPVQNYVVVNYRRKNQSPDQVRPFQIYDTD
ncbi:21429_t:CDS:2 [Dentiscutata erythropus]|uniref:21429_t:CDS:1 n=1 Tax=Dentiscutata erythropus TaxID=1348616 RepID=A0A9N9DLH8_9GLOM|nr:21429_t:CDS:2 [Dentiscutata erythropus]